MRGKLRKDITAYAESFG